MRALLIAGLVLLGSAASGCHILLHRALHPHHHSHVVHVRRVHHRPAPKRVYYVDKTPEPAPEPRHTTTRHKVKLPHEVLKERHKAHKKALKKLFD